MKATLLVNLKIDGKTIDAGTVFDDSEEEFPSYITSNLDNPKVVRLTQGAVTVVKAPVIPKVAKSDKPVLIKKNKG